MCQSSCGSPWLKVFALMMMTMGEFAGGDDARIARADEATGLALLVRVKSPFWTVWTQVTPLPRQLQTQIPLQSNLQRTSCTEQLLRMYNGKKKGRYNHGVVCLLHSNTSSELLHYTLSGGRAGEKNFLSLWFSISPKAKLSSVEFFLRRQWKLSIYCVCIKYVDEYGTLREHCNLHFEEKRRPQQEDIVAFFKCAFLQ